MATEHRQGLLERVRGWFSQPDTTGAQGHAERAALEAQQREIRARLERLGITAEVWASRHVNTRTDGGKDVRHDRLD